MNIRAIQQEIHNYTSIGRTFDPAYPTNLWIMVFTVLAGVVNGALRLFTTGDLTTAISAGFFTGAAVFITWALTREVDMEHEYAAFVAAGLAYLGMLFWGTPAIAILPLAAFIIFARMINRVVGPPFRWWDTLAAVAIMLPCALLGYGVAVLGLGAAFLLDGRLANPLRRHLVLGVLTLLLGMGSLVMFPPTSSELTQTYASVIGFVLVAFGIIVFNFTAEPKIPCDDRQYRFSLDRVRGVMLWVLVMALATALQGGDAAIREYLPLWGVLAGVPLYRLFASTQGKK